MQTRAFKQGFCTQHNDAFEKKNTFGSLFLNAKASSILIFCKKDDNEEKKNQELVVV